ncbi:hypothetical protein ACTFIY_007459 [Dictyostelium cf. discoideum]
MVVEVTIQFWKVKYRNQKSDHDFNDTICSILLGSLQEVFHFFMKPMFFIPYLYIWNNFRILDASTTNVLSFILGFLGIDFSIYCFHRLGHEFNFFWALHVPHHSSDYYNFSSATRQSMFQYIYVWLHYLPMAFFVHPIHYSFHHHWNRIVQFWLHTNVLTGYCEWIEFIFVTPRIHRVHHAKNPQYIDKNYGGMLTIWDKLFGTFQVEDPNVNMEFGITEDDDINTHSTIWLNIHHFVYMYNLSKRLKGFSKLKVIYKPPNWLPEDDYPINNNNNNIKNDDDNNNNSIFNNNNNNNYNNEDSCNNSSDESDSNCCDENQKLLKIIKNNNNNNLESSDLLIKKQNLIGKLNIEDKNGNISKKRKTNDVFGVLMCAYLLMEATNISIILSSLENFKFVFNDKDIYKVAIIIVFQIGFVGSILSKNNSDPIYINSKTITRKSKKYSIYNLISSQQIKPQPSILINDLKISFLESNPVLSLVQMLRMVITTIFFYDISMTNVVPSVQLFFGFLFKFTCIQIVCWFVAVLFSYHKNIIITSENLENNNNNNNNNIQIKKEYKINQLSDRESLKNHYKYQTNQTIEYLKSKIKSQKNE